MIKPSHIRTAMTLVALMLLSSILPGCITNNSDSDPNSPESWGIDTLPQSAIGVNQPAIDGQIDRPHAIFGGWDEWDDSYTLSDSDVDVTYQNGNAVDWEAADIHIKSVGDHVSVALELPLPDDEDLVVTKVSTVFWYDGVKDGYPSLVNSERSSNVASPTSPWLEEITAPCPILASCNSEISFEQVEPFKGLLGVDLLEDESEEVLFSALDLDLVVKLAVAMEHQLAATQSSSMLTLETSRLDALKYSRLLSNLFITVEFEDGAEYEFALSNLYFGYMSPSGWPVANVGIEGVELIQVVQTEDMEMPLLKHKPTLARVYVSSGYSTPVPVHVNIRICVLVFCTDTMTKTVTAPVSVDREDFLTSANFVIPEDWLEYDTIAIIAETSISHLENFRDTDTTNNRDVSFYELTETHSFTAGVIKVGQDTNSDSALEQLSNARATKTMSYSLDLFPVHDYRLENWEWTNSDGGLWDATGCSNNQCIENLSVAFDNYRIQLINEWVEACIDGLNNCDLANPDLPPIPDQLLALYPPSGTGGGIADAGWAGGSSFVATCSYSSSSSVFCPAHEMNHNLGPEGGTQCTLYTDDNGNGQYDGEPADTCTNWEDWGYGPGEWGAHLSKTGVKSTDDCSTSGKDSVWESIYGNTGKPFNIKDLGWNFHDANPEDDQTALIPSSYPDIMTYCQAVSGAVATANPNHYPVPYNADDSEIVKWMSTYRWLLLYDKLSSHETWNPTEAYARAVINQDDHTIRVVNLEIDSDENVLQFRSDLTTGIMSEAFGTGEEDKEGRFSVYALDSNGDTLGVRPINPIFIDSHGDSVGSSFHHVRFADSDSIAEIRLVDSDGQVVSRLSSISDISGYEGDVVNLNSTSYERGSDMHIQWATVGKEGYLYKAEYSKGDGIWYPLSGWVDASQGVYSVGRLPASNAALVRVQMSNGFDSVFMYSTPFVLANQAPTLDVDIRSGHLTINSALPQPHLIPMAGNFSETMAQEVLSQAMRIPAIAVPQHGTITITPNVHDMDWERINDQGCQITLKRGDDIVWSSFNSSKRDDTRTTILRSTHSIDNIFADSKGDSCTSSGNEFSSISFPNPEFPTSMMFPGQYSIIIAYADSSGASATPVQIDFQVTTRGFAGASEVDNYRQKLEFVPLPTLDIDAINWDGLCDLWSAGEHTKMSEEDIAVIEGEDMGLNCALNQNQIENEVATPTENDNNERDED